MILRSSIYREILDTERLLEQRTATSNEINTN